MTHTKFYNISLHKLKKYLQKRCFGTKTASRKGKTCYLLILCWDQQNSAHVSQSSDDTLYTSFSLPNIYFCKKWSQSKLTSYLPFLLSLINHAEIDFYTKISWNKKITQKCSMWSINVASKYFLLILQMLQCWNGYSRYSRMDQVTFWKTAFKKFEVYGLVYYSL